jgi:hypothetical protein
MLDGEEFVIERLFRGSVINYRTFFLETPGLVFLRFVEDSIIMEMPFPVLEKILKKHPVLDKTFNQFKLTFVKSGRNIPLDYIMELPKKIFNKIRENAKKRLIK